jgi:hypothetical protein
MAQFGIPTQDENLQPGWNVQGTGPAQSTTGVPGAGYASAAAIPVTTAVGQVGSGVPNPPGALNVGSENTGAYSTPILENGSYAVTPTTLLTQTAATPTPTTAGVQNPFGLTSVCSMVASAAITATVAPFAPAGITSASWGEPSASATALQVTVPAAGYIKVSAADVTAVTWTPAN